MLVAGEASSMVMEVGNPVPVVVLELEVVLLGEVVEELDAPVLLVVLVVVELVVLLFWVST
jgi:hypothetical protein